MFATRHRFLTEHAEGIDIMTEPQNPQENADVQNDPATPLEQLKPVDVQEVPGDGPEPAAGWGEQGQGYDDEENQPAEGVTGDGQ